uniref:Uncharacterized protein n=1 Tax=Anguilla anguilla TaxID=7936 RepID=A0A0E9XAE9_ANGAN
MQFLQGFKSYPLMQTFKNTLCSLIKKSNYPTQQ